jgi:hypothetical protein
MFSFETLTFFRGVGADIRSDHPTICSRPSHRSPKHTSQRFHNIADAWFLNRFDIAYRSASLFVTSDIEVAKAHAGPSGHVVRLIPIADYKFCWSPNVRDLYLPSKKHDSASVEEICAELERLAYREDGLGDAHNSGNEVMVSCAHYLLIPIHLCALGEPSSSDGRIILG